MTFTVAHRLPGRIRLRCGRWQLNDAQAAALSEHLKKCTGVVQADVSPRTGSVLIVYQQVSEQEIIAVVGAVRIQELDQMPVQSRISRNTEDFAVALGKKFFLRYLIRPFMPLPLRHAVTVVRSLGYLKKGIDCIVKDKAVGVEVLDAAAITCSLVQRSFNTAGSIMFLLSVSEMIEDWTRKKSREDLAESLILNVDQVWIEKDGQQISVPLSSIQDGDLAILRSGGMIPVDGAVISGEAMVNQAVLTGEPLAVRRGEGSTVYAGTFIEEGEIIVRVTGINNETRIHSILKLVDESEHHKAQLQGKSEKLADSIVPFSFLGALAVYAVTRNFAKAASVLLVDYSCAIKLSTSLSVLGALQEAAAGKMVVKGGKFLEAAAEADTIVFDKTGTLTVATPTVKNILCFDEYTRDEVLKVSACLEEHFPHSVARAVVKKAEVEGIIHQEEHSQVEYIVAHGIVSRLNDQRVIIGSQHFVFEDENVLCDDEKMQRISREVTTESVLYLAVDGILKGVILIEDPVRAQAAHAIAGLRRVGFKHIVMLTGDSENTARNVAEQLGIDMYQAQMLPEEKSQYIQDLRKKGHKVMMVGDGVNDTPALSAAGVGVAMKDSSDIAREVSDITLLTSDLQKLILLRRISMGMLQKIKWNYQFILGFNTLLLGTGLFQVVTSAQSAFLHNASTIGLGVRSLRPVVKST